MQRLPLTSELTETQGHAVKKTQLLFLFLACLLLGALLTSPAYGGEEKTPLAGEPLETEVLGEEVKVPARDRRIVTAASFGVQYLPFGPSFYQVLPFGALYVWRNWDDGRSRLRGTFTGLVNDVNFNVGSKSSRGWELIFTLDNMIIPVGRSEFVEGQRISQVDVEWN